MITATLRGVKEWGSAVETGLKIWFQGEANDEDTLSREGLVKDKYCLLFGPIDWCGTLSSRER